MDAPDIREGRGERPFGGGGRGRNALPLLAEVWFCLFRNLNDHELTASLATAAPRGGKAYELKATLNAKHRMVEIVWGGMLLLLLMLTAKEQIDVALGATAGVVGRVSTSFANNNNGKKQI